MGRGGQRNDFPVLLQHIPGRGNADIIANNRTRAADRFDCDSDRMQTLGKEESPSNMSSGVIMCYAHTRSRCCCFQWQQPSWSVFLDEHLYCISVSLSLTPPDLLCVAAGAGKHVEDWAVTGDVGRCISNSFAI